MAEFSLQGTALDPAGNGSEAVTSENSGNAEVKSTEAVVEKTEVEPKDETETSTSEKETYLGITKEERNSYLLGKDVKTETKESEVKDTEKTEVNKEADVPETYEFKFPDGLDLSCDIMDKFKEMAKNEKMSNDKAQKYVDLVSDMVLRERQNQEQLLDKVSKQWRQEILADPEIGGDKVSDSLKIANKAIDRFGGVEFRKFLDLTSIGNNKAMVKFLYNVGKQISEGSFVISNKGPVPTKQQDSGPEYTSYGQPKLYFPSMEKK